MAFLVAELGLEPLRVEAVAPDALARDAVAEKDLHFEGVEALHEGTCIHSTAIVAKSARGVNVTGNESLLSGGRRKRLVAMLFIFRSNQLLEPQEPEGGYGRRVHDPAPRLSSARSRRCLKLLAIMPCLLALAFRASHG